MLACASQQALPAAALAAARALPSLLGRLGSARGLHSCQAAQARHGGEVPPGLSEKERSDATGGAQRITVPELEVSCVPAFSPPKQRLFDLSGRTALVTGAAQGMGSWIAMGMARCGADVALLDFGNEEKLETVAQYVRDAGSRAVTLRADVKDRHAVEQAVERAAAELGGPHILVANAGILGKLQHADKISRSVWHDVLETNVTGAYHCCRAAYPHMREAGGGKIILMSSIAGIRGFGAQVAYCASKGALLPMAKSLAVAWGKDNIQVNCLLPGAINTPFLDTILNTQEKVDYVLHRIPAGRLGASQDVVGPAVFLASTASDYITGAELIVDGGGTVLPMVVQQDPEDFQMR